MQRPRVRTKAGTEAELPIYRQLQSPEAMPQAALARMVRGVSTRDYEGVVDVAREGFGVAKSSVSRAFVKATAEGVKQLSERKLDQERFLAIFVDGVEYAGETLIVALGVTDQGEKRILGVRQGGTENSAVCIALFEDLQTRGLPTDRPMLFVLDGSKALHSAVKKVWGEKALIQRCQIHKRRNVLAHLPGKHHAECVRQLSLAYQETSYEAALKQLKLTASWLDRLNPDAAASLREGMEETLTVVKLGLPPALQRTFVTTNPIESAFSVVRRVTSRVTRWRDGNMRLRWASSSRTKVPPHQGLQANPTTRTRPQEKIFRFNP
jgi:putative transposase